MNFDGITVCDCFTGYDKNLSQKSKFQRCRVHARRYLTDAIKGLKGEPPEDIKEWLNEINKLFESEREIKNSKYDEVLKIRQEKESQIVKNIYKFANKFKKSNVNV